MEALASTIKEEKEIKHIQIEKEEVNKLCLFTENTNMPIKNPKDSAKTSVRIGEFIKIAGYWSINKNCTLYTSNERLKIEI